MPMHWLLLALAGLLSACGDSTAPAGPSRGDGAVDALRADTIYAGGTIITIDQAQPEVEAVAVRDGRIIDVGRSAYIESEYLGPSTQWVDLGGNTMLPGFLDPHSHITHALKVVDWANVSRPPVGPVDSIARLVETLEAHLRQRSTAAGEWLVAYGYDADGLEEQRHVTRRDLDPHFPDRPVMLIHVSSHGAVLNSAALAAVGYDAETATPEGGIIVREEGSNEPAGLIMETAFFPLLFNQEPADQEQELRKLDAVQKLYASNGYTTIQDGASDAKLIELLSTAADRSLLYLDIVALPFVESLGELDAAGEREYGSYRGRFKFGGVKLVADGSPQGRTAFFTEPLLTEGPGGEPNWRGEPVMPAEAYREAVAGLVTRGIQVWSHANGDAAIDMVIDAHAALGVSAADDRRSVVIHSQFVRPDQLQAYARHGIAASFFSNHAFFWGDVHMQNLGRRRAEFLSPLKAAAELGIRYSNHSDFLVTPLNPFFIVWTAVSREMRSGEVLGPDQRVDVLQALKALTIDSAWMYREEEDKGSISTGKLADFVVVDRNPLKTPTAVLPDIAVLATIKEDKLVYGSL